MDGDDTIAFAIGSKSLGTDMKRFQEGEGSGSDDSDDHSGEKLTISHHS